MFEEEEVDKPEIIIIVLVGNNVGKTTIIYKYVDFQLSGNSLSTYGSSF